MTLRDKILHKELVFNHAQRVNDNFVGVYLHTKEEHDETLVRTMKSIPLLVDLYYEVKEAITKKYDGETWGPLIKSEEIINKIDKKCLPKVFLGGTRNGYAWRESLIKKLKINYFNPIVDDWTHECQKEEKTQRKNCEYVLYVITPEMSGAYSIAEAVEDSIKRPEKTVFCYLTSCEDLSKKFTEGQVKSLEMVEKMIRDNGATCCHDLTDVAEFLNEKQI